MSGRAFVVLARVVFTIAWLAGRATADPIDPRALVPTLRANDFASVEAQLAALEKSGARTREGWLAFPRSCFALGVAAAEDPAIAASLAAWLQVTPRAWTAELIDGWRLLMQGVAPRADDRSLDQPEIWRQDDPGLRAIARTNFERAFARAPHSAEPAAALIAIQVLEGAPLEERFAMLAQACAAEPRCESARVTMLTGLEPHLGGSNELLVAFARKVASEHPDDPIFGLFVGMAHRKAAVGTGDPKAYFAAADVFEETDRSYARHLAAYPDALRHWNEYARIAGWSGRRETARRIFERIGDAYVGPAWKSDFREFAKRREWALAVTEADARVRLAP